MAEAKSYSDWSTDVSDVAWILMFAGADRRALKSFCRKLLLAQFNARLTFGMPWPLIIVEGGARLTY